MDDAHRVVPEVTRPTPPLSTMSKLSATYTHGGSALAMNWNSLSRPRDPVMETIGASSITKRKSQTRHAGSQPIKSGKLMASMTQLARGLPTGNGTLGWLLHLPKQC